MENKGIIQIHSQYTNRKKNALHLPHELQIFNGFRFTSKMVKFYLSDSKYGNFKA